jgi:fibro-slime domain-containing protein
VFEVRTYTSCETYTAVTCVFRGGSDQAHPTKADQLAKAVAYNQFEGCYEGFKNVGNRGTKLVDAAPGGVLSGNAAAASVLNGGNTCAGEQTQVTFEYQACGGSPTGGAPACCEENLIKAGDFEGCQQNHINVETLPGWVITDKVDWWIDDQLDKCVVDLAGSPGPGKISQTITTVPGAQYELLLDARANNTGGKLPRAITMAAGATSKTFLIDAKRQSLTLPFTATGTQTVIALSSPDVDNFGVHVDNIRVRPVVCDQTCDPSIPSDPPPTIKLTGTLRDFKFEHPDFEGPGPGGYDKGIVQPDLGPDGKPVYAGQDGNPTTSGKANFDQWFNDVPGVNTGIAHAITLDLVSQDPPLYRFDSPNFFPADGQGFGNEGGYAHNFSFTYELATYFQYRGGETFTFTGDDDVFVYINNKLVIDLGGIHGPETATVDLDEVAATLGLQIGENYPLKLFFSERRTGGSSFRIDTSIEGFSECTTDCNPISDNKSFVWQATKDIGISTLQGAYHDVDRDELAVFSYYPSIGGKVFDRITGALKRDEKHPPGLANIDGATYDPATKHALFVDQSCNLVEAPTTDLTKTTGFGLAKHGGSVCAGIAIGRDGNLYIVSHGTNEVIVVGRDGSKLVRKFSTAKIFGGIDGILSIPGSNKFLIAASASGLSAIIDSEGNVVVPAAQSGTPKSPLTGGEPFVSDGLLGICSTGHIWACDESGTKCRDFAPAGGDVNTCPCLGEEEQCVSEELIKSGTFDGCADQTNPASIPGWTVTGGVDWWWGASYGNPLLTPQMDGCGVDLVGTPGPGKISQVIATVPGGKYELKVDSTPNTHGAPAVKALKLSAGATTQDYMISGARKTLTLPFTATQAQTTIELSSSDQGNYGPYVDNVSVKRIDCEGGGGETCLFPDLPPSDPDLTTIEGFSATVVLDLAKQLPGYNNLGDVERAVGPYWGKPGEGVLFTVSKVGSPGSGIGRMTQDGTFSGWLVDPASNKLKGNTYLEYGYGGTLYGCASPSPSNDDSWIYKILPDGTVENVAPFYNCEGLSFGDRGDGVNRLYAGSPTTNRVALVAADGTVTTLATGLGIVQGLAIPGANSAFQPGLYAIDRNAGTHRITANNGATLDYPYSLGYGVGEVLGFAPPKSAFGDYSITCPQRCNPSCGSLRMARGRRSSPAPGSRSTCIRRARCSRPMAARTSLPTKITRSCACVAASAAAAAAVATPMVAAAPMGTPAAARAPRKAIPPAMIAAPPAAIAAPPAGPPPVAAAVSAHHAPCPPIASSCASSGRATPRACAPSRARPPAIARRAGAAVSSSARRGPTACRRMPAVAPPVVRPVATRVPAADMCLADNECPAAAPECFNVPMSDGKRCGGCKNDAQCGGGGCTFPNPYVAAGSYCGGGGAGEGCESDTACLDATGPLLRPGAEQGRPQGSHLRCVPHQQRLRRPGAQLRADPRPLDAPARRNVVCRQRGPRQRRDLQEPGQGQRRLHLGQVRRRQGLERLPDGRVRRVPRQQRLRRGSDLQAGRDRRPEQRRHRLHLPVVRSPANNSDGARRRSRRLALGRLRAGCEIPRTSIRHIVMTRGIAVHEKRGRADRKGQIRQSAARHTPCTHPSHTDPPWVRHRGYLRQTRPVHMP